MSSRVRYPPIRKSVYNLLFVTDIHVETPDHASQWLSYKMRDDINTCLGAQDVDALVFGGDFIGAGTTCEVAEAQAWVDSLSLRDRVPIALVPGNHDLIGMQSSPGDSFLITPAQWAILWAGYGVTGKNYHVDLGDDLRLLCMSPSDSTPQPGPTWRLMLDAPSLQQSGGRQAVRWSQPGGGLWRQRVPDHQPTIPGLGLQHGVDSPQQD